MSDEFESCTNCIHSADAEALCILRLCKHAIAETKECYMPKVQPSFPQRHENDCISRADTIDALCKAGCGSKYCGISCDDVKAIEDLPSAQPETHEERTKTHTCDLISRQAAIDALKEHRALFCDNTPDTFAKLSYGEKCRVDELDGAIATLINLPSVQPDIPPYVAEIEAEYKKAVSMPYVNKPLAYALFRVWKKHNREEVSRNG